MGGKLPEKDDRRVQRTRRALREAFVTLMVERGWAGFSVQDVCDRADVGRSTFYTHFADKEDLVKGGLEDLREALGGHLAELGGERRALGFSRGLVEHAFEQQRLVRALICRRGGADLVHRLFREMVLALVRDDLARRLPAGHRREAAAAFLAGAIVELLSWALEAKSGLGPEQVDALYQELARPVLAAARG